MRPKSIKMNYIYNTGYQILNLIVPLLTTPYISRVLGVDAIGIYSFTASIVSYFTLFASMGTATYGQREISYLQNDRKQRTRTFWEIELLSIISTFFVLALYFIFILSKGFSLIYIIQSLSIIAVATDITWLFAGMEEFGRIVVRNLITKLLNILFVFLMIRSVGDLNLYIFGLCFLVFLNTISIWPSIKLYVDLPEFNKLRPLRHFKFVMSLFIPTIAIQIYTVLDKTMIGIFTNEPSENGYYEQALKLSKMALTIVTSLGTVMVPRIGHYYNNNDIENVKLYLYRGYNFVWLLGIPLCFGLIGVSGNLVPWFYGDGYDKVVVLLSILGFLVLAIGINNVTGIQYMVPTKRQNYFTLSVCVGAIINFMMNLILIPRFQSVGASLSSVTAEVIIAALQLYIVRKELSALVIIKMCKNYLMAGIIMYIFLRILSFYLVPSLVNSLILVTIGAVVYILMLIILRDKFFIDNFKRLLKK